MSFGSNPRNDKYGNPMKPGKGMNNNAANMASAPNGNKKGVGSTFGVSKRLENVPLNLR